MTDKLLCPFCNQQLEPIGTSGQFQCGTWGCDASFNFYATRDVWEYIARTRKALDVGKQYLMRIGYLDMTEHGLGSEKMMTDWCKTVALYGLKEIETALEQKDVK